MEVYSHAQAELLQRPRTWLITGVAGFVGSHLLEALLKLRQQVVGLDNFATGYQHNLDLVRDRVGAERWRQFRFLPGTIEDAAQCRAACAGVDVVLHQAVLGCSVERSLTDPLACHSTNVTGFLNVLDAARRAHVPRFVYASSCTVYGNESRVPLQEHDIGRPLSPYGVSKRLNELYAETYVRAYGYGSIGLRYFNVFGPRQDPNGAYAAVIPKWIEALLQGERVQINGDGETSRDFCFVDNVVQANLLAATVRETGAMNQIYNIAVGERTTLNQLFQLLQSGLRQLQPGLPEQLPHYAPERVGDVRHSHADISKAQRLLGYVPLVRAGQGLEQTMAWYRTRQR